MESSRLCFDIGWRRLTPDSDHFLFGYYDRNPWDPAGRRHLALKVPQCDRLPEPGETAEIGFFDIEGGGFVRCATTRSWCHQQGAMQQWVPGRTDTFVYNDFLAGDGGGPFSRLHRIGDGLIGGFSLPVYALSPDGRWAASLDFSRIPRRGYSYADTPVPVDRPHPDLDRDGLSVIDLSTGEAELIVSYRQIVSHYPFPYELDHRYWWLNHAQFNRDSTRIQFLFRHADSADDGGGWSTTMFTVDIDGTELRCVLPNVYWSGMISHQLWGRTPDELLVDANWRGCGHEYVVLNDAVDFRAGLISSGLGPMGHLVFSPAGDRLLADTYAIDGVQRLALVDAATGGCEVIGQFHHELPPDLPTDLRCDLHPRWSADGRLISVDSIDHGHRGIYVAELPAELMEAR